MKTNVNLLKIDVPKIRFFNYESMKYDNVLRLTIGEPHFPPPKEVKDFAIQGIENNEYKYVLGLGRKDTRKSIVSYIKKYFNQEYEIDEVLVTVGSTEGLSSTLGAILNPNDEVIIPTPAYAGYEPIVILNHSKSVFMDTSKDNFQLRYDNIKNHITKRTKCIVLNYPNNPTGITLDKQSIDDITKILKEYDIFVVLDEIYNRIVFCNTYAIDDTEVKDKLIIVNGLSKSHSLTGWRFGFVLASKDMIKKILKVHQYIVVAVNTVTQFSATQIDSDISDRIDYYAYNIEYAYHRLVAMGLEVIKPSGTYYIFPKVPCDSVELFYELLEKERVAVIPGICFGDYPNYIRLSCTVDFDTLVTALNRIEKVIKEKGE
ncbi:aminotransferase class I/II-fold pyridoxal phosphate-dependent enzyme [Mycoplasmatota bacterium WC44]